jgi:hypothetical protein
MIGLMPVDRAIVRIALFAAATWLLFWGWRYITGCIHGRAQTFFCPNASGETLVRTDFVHIGFFLLMPPLLGLAISLWVLRHQQRQL